jgi:hypothetical protein
MAELAADGGCMTVDVEDTQALSASLERLVEDAGLRQRLSIEASRRRLKTWQGYVRDFYGILGRTPERVEQPLIPEAPIQVIPAGESLALARPDSWMTILYPRLRVDKWQMHDSERLALTALLARTRPTCVIELGTYFGGSLSLLSEYAEWVYSIDLDPDMPKRVGPLPNITYLTGRSDQLLPVLLEELDASSTAVNLLLIDAEHSTEGVRRDISLVLEHVPREPMFVLVYDSFNPSCRQGMLQALWQDSPYCQFVDIDFVPGRLVEHPGSGHDELWGGLAMAFFSPTLRRGPLVVAQSASKLFAAAQAAFANNNKARIVTQPG